MPAEGVKRPGACLWLAAPDVCAVPEGDGGRSLQTDPLPARPPGDKSRVMLNTLHPCWGFHSGGSARETAILLLPEISRCSGWARKYSEVYTGLIRQHRLSRLSASNTSMETTGPGEAEVF